MLDSRDIQKRRKQEQAGRHEPPYLDDTTKMLVFIFGICAVVLLPLLIFIAVEEREQEVNCEDLGGEYKIIDREFAGKTAVNIYGCVK